ncbi:MAG: PAS domain S-box protein [Ignavibacteriae bacterium]|nr:PAS domain S-box protein [Ignavibacteriota bacterium]
MDKIKVLSKKFFNLLQRPHYKIALIYLIISFLWIIFSDKIAYEAFSSLESFKYIQSVKGLFFIIATSLLIFLLIRNDYRTIKEKNNQLNDSKIKMQLAFDSSNIGTYEFDIENDLVYFDEKSQEIFGVKKSQLKSHEILNQIHPNDLQMATESLEKAIRNENEIKSIATFRIMRNNEIRWIDSTIIMYTNEDKKSLKNKWGIGTFLDITDKKKSTEQLTILQYAIENANIGIFKIDEEGNINYTNQFACDYLGYTKEEISNLNISDIDRTMIPERFKKHRKFVKENIYNTIETTHTKKDGTSFPVEVTVNYFSYENQLLAISFSKDITERKQSAEKILREKNILRLFIQYAPAAIAMFDNEMKYVSVSKRYCLDYNISDENIIGKSHYEIFPEIGDNWKQIHKQCLAGKTEKCDEDQFLRMDGNIDWVRWEIRPWYENKDQIGGIILFSELITNQKNAEEKIRLSEERLKVALQGADLGTYDWNVETNEVIYDERWAEMLGLNVNEISKSFDTWVNLVNQEDYLYVQKKLEDHMNGLTEFYEAEYRIKHKNGNWIWILDKGKVVEKNVNGKPQRVAGTHMDISARKEAEIELNKTKDQLRALFANIDNVREDERKNLARELHDELGQVLTSLNMNLSLLKNNIENNLFDNNQLISELTEMSEIIDESKINMKKLIRSLRPEYLDNLGLIPAINHLIEEFNKNKSVCINLNCNFDEINFDPKKENILYRVVQETLTNIIKHAKASKVEVNLFIDDSKLFVNISDDGIGINSTDYYKENSFGIIGMRERLSQIGSDLEIVSEQKKGTKISFEISM